ncbi:MAG: DUF3363 domain-containing protein [Gammaproteobacteria bacterium]
MAERDDDRFRPKLRPPRDRGNGEPVRFVSRVLKATSRAGQAGAKGGRRPGVFRGRGVVAARLAMARSQFGQRRVIVKVRVVRLGAGGLKSSRTHLRYLERAGVSREGESGQAYGPQTEAADAAAFSAAGAGDRHQFRAIVAPEDATEIGDLHGYTRRLLARVEQDLGTRLEWIAVDHWDTDNPHTHIVIRGRDESGGDLVISREYITHGLRVRATELATEWLGPRTEAEIQASLTREISQDRWTSLDRSLQRLAQDGQVDLRVVPADVGDRLRRSLMVGRLQQLGKMGLAQEAAPSVWTIDPRAEQTLRELGERGDIIRTMQRAFGTERRHFAFFDAAAAAQPVVGRIAAKGLADELQDRGYLVVDGLEGRAHHVALPARIDLSELPVGGIVAVRVRNEVRSSDRTIAALATDGHYRTARHLTVARLSARPGQDPDAFVAAHVRRLEALRRGGVVERVADGVWRVPPDLPERGRLFDRRDGNNLEVELKSVLPAERQVRVIGATWLDQQLMTGDAGIGTQGFGGEVRSLLARRGAFLVEHQLAEPRDGHAVLTRDAVATLRQRDLAAGAAKIAAETGRDYRPIREGQAISGTYRRALWFASGQFAVIDDGGGFSLVPWRPVLAGREGQAMGAIVRGDSVTWQLGRHRTLSR